MKKKCVRCRSNAVVELRYSGELLCKKHFTTLFEKRVRKTIRVNRLLEHDDRVGVALSGGKDSAATLHILHILSRRAPKSKLVGLTVDGGIRGYSSLAVKAAEKLCKNYGIEHHTYSFKKEFGFTLDDIMKKRREGEALACTYCGVLRRRLLNENARKLGIDKIATGHNLDDEVQTGLMNFIRGDLVRIARAGAIVGVIKNKKFIPRIKPLRECPEDEIRFYAKLKKIPFVKVRCPYSTVALRTSMRHALNDMEARHPGTKFQTLGSIDKLSAILKERFRGYRMRECASCGELTSGRLCKVCEIIKNLG